MIKKTVKAKAPAKTAPAVFVAPAEHKTLSRGSEGPEVANLQRALGIDPVTGSYDFWTVVAVKEWQKASGFPATGVADPDTLAKLLG